jgi:hypothetical protein
MSNYQNRNNAPRYSGNGGGGQNGPFVPKDGRGALWPNDNIQNDKSPQFKGSILINGVEYWLSMWEGDGNGPNSPLFSVTVQPKESSQGQGWPQGQYRQQGGQRQQDRGRQQRGAPPQQGGYRQGPQPQQGGYRQGPPQNNYAAAKAGDDGGPPQQQANGHWDENNCWIEE